LGKLRTKDMTDFFMLFLCIMPIYFLIYALAGFMPWSDNPYNSYTLQAAAWLNGRLDLGRDYSHLEIACYQGKYFISFPPFPSYVMLPFAIFFGTHTPDNWIAMFTALLGAVFTLRLLHDFGKTGFSGVFWALFMAVGTNLLFVCVNGWVWFIAQNMCYTLTIMCLFYANRGRGGAALLLWAASVGCRPFQALYIPIILYILYVNSSCQNPFQMLRRNLTWLIGPIALGGSYMLLNYLRFGSIFEFGHNYLPEFVEAKNGQFSLTYIKDNLPLLFRIPKMADGKWTLPKFDGMAFWMVSPVFISYLIYVILSIFKKEKVNLALAVGIPLFICVHFLLLTMHKTMGGWHFGNRYTNDALPFLLYAVLMLMPKNDKYEFLHYPLFLFGLALNAVGTAAVYNRWI